VSTHVDGEAPSLAPEPDSAAPQNRPAPGRRAGPPGSGSGWVRSEMQRLMAANRTSRGRHARHGTPALPEHPTGDDQAPEDPPPGPEQQPPGPAAYPSAAELPENYIPRHSVQTPGPAAQPAAPLSGPTPVVGGPSLPPNGLIRRRRGGPGTPLQAERPAGTGPWSGPSPVVPPAPTQRLGAPPETPGGPERTSWPGEVLVPTPGLAAVPPPGFRDLPGPELGFAQAPAAPPAPPEAVNGTAAATATPATPVLPAAPAAPAPPVGPPSPSPRGRVDTPTTPHPLVGRRSTGERLGPAQRTSAHGRQVRPRPITPRQIPVIGTAPPEPGSTRVRVVLSERKGVARPVRTIKEVQEGTAVGELLRRDLIRSQLKVTLRFAGLTALVLGALPALFVMAPEVARLQMAGVRLPWLLLGVFVYPFLVGVAWRFTRVADRVEQNFADHVQD
jgi:hypothetical protein